MRQRHSTHTHTHTHTTPPRMMMSPKQNCADDPEPTPNQEPSKTNSKNAPGEGSPNPPPGSWGGTGLLFPGGVLPSLRANFSGLLCACQAMAMAVPPSLLRGAFRLSSSSLLSSPTLSSRALICLPCAGSKVSPSFGGGFGVFLDEKDVDCSFLGTKGFASSAAAKGGVTPQQAYEYEVRLLFFFFLQRLHREF